MLRGKSVGLSKDFRSGWNLTIQLDDDSVPSAKELVDKNWDDVLISVKQYSKRRSLDANNYAWVLIGKIALATKTDKMSVYRQAVKDLGGNFDFICVTEQASETFRKNWVNRGEGWLCEEVDCKIAGCVKYQVYYGSSVYDTKLMSAFIDRLVDDAKDLGIETMPPRELEALKGEWQ